MGCVFTASCLSGSLVSPPTITPPEKWPFLSTCLLPLSRRPSVFPFLASTTTMARVHGLPCKNQQIDNLEKIRGDPSRFHPLFLPLLLAGGSSGGDNDNNNNGGWDNPFNSEGSWWWNDDSSGPHNPFLVFLLFCSSMLFCFCHLQLAKSALARTTTTTTSASTSLGESELLESLSVWEVRGGKWTKLIADCFKDVFVIEQPGTGSTRTFIPEKLWLRCRDLFMGLMLPDGFPHSVTSDYLEYSLWRGVQGIASQISGVLATQALLYAVGLGKGAIPTAAAVNWVLKDGIGYLSKIMLSKYGRHFDVHPKGWRLFADLLENTAFGLEMLTPAFPHLFVFIGATAGAGRSAAALIQVTMHANCCLFSQ